MNLGVNTTEKFKILVTGANGYVGHCLCSALIKDGQEVYGAVRSNAGAINDDITYVTLGHFDEETDWSSTLVGIDVVIHLAARVHVMRDGSRDPMSEFRNANVFATENLARSAAAQGVKRLVYVSSIKVNGEETKNGQCFSESDAASPVDFYGISKWEAELALHQISNDTGMQIVIVRPPLVYGANVKGNFLRMLNLVSKGYPLPLASINNLRSMLYVENLADALRLCAVHPAAVGNTYVVSDGEDISTPELLRQLAYGLGMLPRIIVCPVWLLKLAGRLTGKSAEISRLTQSLQIDSRKIQRDLNWHPPYTLRQGMKLTSDWYKAGNS
jgi:nucleoside-diphosphate-sugar epimerase